jgi:uncharacterized membrane protein
MSIAVLRCAALLAALCFIHGARAETVLLQPVGPVAVTGLSSDGLVATGQMNDDYQTFRWTMKDGVVPLGRATWLPLGKRSGIPSISDNGRVIASSILSDAGTCATSGRWTLGAGWQQIAPPLPPGGGVMDAEDSSVFGMSRDGKLVTGLFWRPNMPGGSAHGYAWTAVGNMVDMGSDGNSSRIDGANADGSVLVGWDEHPQFGNRRAAVWVNGVKTVLDNSDWFTEASAVNAAGNIIVGSAPDNDRMAAVMWKWNGSAWVRSVLGLVPQSRPNGVAYPSGVSDDGSVVIGTARRDGSRPTSVGFIWTAQTGMLDAMDWLKSVGHDLTRKVDVIELSAITGSGRVIAAASLDVLPPHTLRSFLIRRVQPGGQE